MFKLTLAGTLTFSIYKQTYIIMKYIKWSWEYEIPRIFSSNINLKKTRMNRNRFLFCKIFDFVNFFNESFIFMCILRISGLQFNYFSTLYSVYGIPYTVYVNSAVHYCVTLLKGVSFIEQIPLSVWIDTSISLHTRKTPLFLIV